MMFRKNILACFFILSLILNMPLVCIGAQENKNINTDDLLNPPKKIFYIEKEEKNLYYIQKSQDKQNDKKVSNIKIDETKIVKKNCDKKETKNYTTKANDRIISTSQRLINAIYPNDEVSLSNTYPGYRGPNQLVIYTKEFGRTTGTNEFGKEAVVVDGVVDKLTGANSNIPRNGFVISGHGTAKKWINDNLKIGTKVEIENRTITAYTTIDSYRYFAKSKINDVEDILVSTKSDYDSRDDKYIYYYFKRAKQQYKKSLKDNSDVSLNCAKEAIKNASIAFRYTLPYLKDEIKGVWIRPTDNTIAGIQKTLDIIKDTGINNVFLETYFHGRTIYPSIVMKSYGFEEQNPDFKGIDALGVWVKEAHKRGIKVHTWFESFYVGNRSPQLNPKSILAIRPDWQNRTRQKADYDGYVSHPQEHNGYFLDPANPEVTSFILKLISEIITRYNVDGVNIDYVRYPNLTKDDLSNQWGYTPFARDEFKKVYEIDPVEITQRDSLWDKWCEYRQDKITDYVQRASVIVRSKNVVFSAVVFPDYKISLRTKQQDWVRWSEQRYVDVLTPLILTSDDTLAKSMLEEIKKKASDDVKVYPGLFAGFIESDPEDLLRQIHIIRKLKLQGVVLFDWAHLSSNYLEVLKTSVFKPQTY